MARKKVLVVDDEPDYVETIKFCLESSGIECVVAHDGRGGLSLAREKKPDLILLDVMLPAMDGYEVCRLLKKDQACKRIPIIMLSARTDKVDVNTGLEAGAETYITKPFDIDNVIDLIKGYLFNRQI